MLTRVVKSRVFSSQPLELKVINCFQYVNCKCDEAIGSGADDLKPSKSFTGSALLSLAPGIN